MAIGRINTKGIANFINKLKKIPSIVSGVNQIAAQLFLQMLLLSYDKETDPSGRKWAKKKIPNGYKILHSSRNRLKNSIKIVRSSKNGFTIGTRVPYGQYHMTGTSKMPARPFLLTKNKIPQQYVKTYMKLYREQANKLINSK